jgi:cysteine-rich repeat protein
MLRSRSIAVAVVLSACSDPLVSADGGSSSSEATASDGSTSSPHADETTGPSGEPDTTDTPDPDGSTSPGDSSTGSAETSTEGDATLTSTPLTCGDGVLDPDEECDDDNLIDDDGCDVDCVPSLVVEIATGTFVERTCVRTRTGAVRCWGRNSGGQLGYGNQVDVGDDEVPADVGSIELGGSAVQLAGSSTHTCALLDDGAVRCWGGGNRLGYGNTENIGDDEVPADAGDLDLGGDAVQITAGPSHTCALLENAAVRCWGLADGGALGHGDLEPIGDDETPATAGDIDVGGDSPVVELAAGNGHTCARLESGAVRCWGFNSHGQLGLGHTDAIGDDELPSSAADVVVVDPEEGDEVVEISANLYLTCARLASGNARCWGYSENGECGHSSTENIGDDETPASWGDISLGGTVVELSAGPCARLDDGTLRCWGYGFTGALGLGYLAHIGDDDLPTSVGPIAIGGAAVHHDSDGRRACAILDGGDLRCWGRNDAGQLGYGNTTDIGDDELPDSVGPVQVF